ncbi:hypothetical protein AAG906_039281 [Vitis piasezkii]
MNIRCRCSGRRFLSGIHLLSEVKKDVIRELGFGGLLQLGCKEVSLTCHDVGMTMGIPHSGRKLIVEKASVKASQMPSLQDIESMMVGIDDMEEFKRVFLIFASNLIGTHISLGRRKESVWIKGCLMFLVTFVLFITMYVELNTPRIVAWNDFLVKQSIKLELEMLGGFDKVEVICARMEATQCQITDAQSHFNSLIASYNRDVKVLRTRFTSSHYRTDEGQPSNFHEHVNEKQHSPVHSGGQRRSSEDDLRCTNEGMSERPNVEDGVFFSNEDPFTWATQYVGVSASKMKVRHHRQRAACKSPFVQLCVSKYKRLTEEETYVANYVFDESKYPSEMLCAYGGYGVTREQLQCLVISMFFQYMNAKEENPSRRHFFNPYFGSYIVTMISTTFTEICGSMSKSTSKSTLKKRLGSYCVNLEFGFMSQLLKNSFKRNDVNINNLHPQYADIVGDPKLCHLGMYAILYMQHWDGSVIEEDEFDAIKRMHLREARKKALQK